MQTAIQVAFELSVKQASTSQITSEQLQNQLQNAMQTAIQVAFELSVKQSTGERIKNSEISETLKRIMKMLEEKLSTNIDFHLRGTRTRMHAQLSSTIVAHMVQGKPEFNTDGKIISFPKPKKLDGQAMSSLSYTPRRNLFFNTTVTKTDPTTGQIISTEIDSEFSKAITKFMAPIRSKVAKNARLPGGQALDMFMNTKIGKIFMNFIDFFDNIADALSVACTFTDGFFYDPNGTGLSWEPWNVDTFRYTRQKMIDAQVRVIQEYNNQNTTDDFDYPYSVAQYPIIVGPLETISIHERYNGDVEYIQMKIGSMVDAVIENILRDKTRPYYQKLMDLYFRDEGILDLEEVYNDPLYPDDKLIYYLSYIENNDCKDYDDLYREAFTKVCTEAPTENVGGGVVYEDEYMDIVPKPSVNCPRGYKRRRFQCGFKTRELCDTNASRYVQSNGQVGSYGEWNDMTELFDTDDNRLVPDSSRIYTKSGTGDVGTTEACILTGRGVRSLCKEATGSDDHYKYEKDIGYHCKFTEELCQSFGTCVKIDKNSGQPYCYIPKELQACQGFFGNQLPREWVRIHGCHYAPISEGNTDEQNMKNVLNFFSSGGKHFFNDMLANKSNWNAGMKNMFLGADALDTWFNIATIIGPMIASFVGVGTGPIMIAIIIVVCAKMADEALKENRKIAQNIPKEAAEYTVGGWETDDLYSTVFSLVSATTTSVTTSSKHNIGTGSTVSLIGMSWTDGTSTYVIPKINVIVTAVTDNELSFSILAVTLQGFVQFFDNRGYVKEIKQNPQFVLNDITGRKKPNSIGYIDGWLTKPLRPRDNQGQIVPVTSGVSSIAGVEVRDFFNDVQSNNRAFPEGSRCTMPTDAVERLKQKINDWDFSQLKNKFEDDAQAIGEEFQRLKDDTQARLDSLQTQRRDLDDACKGTGFFTNRCWDLIGSAGFGTIEAAFSNLDKQIVEVGEAYKIMMENVDNSIRELFTWLGNQIKNIFEEGANIVAQNADASGRCVNTRIKLNFEIGQALGNFYSGKFLKQVTEKVLDEMGCPDDIKSDILNVQRYWTALMTFGTSESNCIMTGKINDNVGAFDPECYMAVAVDSATGTIRKSEGNPVNLHVDWDDWMDNEEYKRMCSQSSTPMIRAWNASLSNRVFCMPPRPPETWADPNIGILDPLETQYAVNRSWTNFGDGPEYFSFDYPQYPDGVMYHQAQETRERDSAKHWWYQLVYSKDHFNRNILWDNQTLLRHFTYETITQMRIEYCTDDLLGNENRGIEPIDPSLIDDKCWGYLSITIPGYTYMPMTILSKITNTQ
jgi:hypothetical protein